MIFIASIFIIVFLFISSASAFSYGPNYNYSVNVLPNNSYVHQGENISQGNYYDLSGVYGWSGLLAHWKNDDNAGYTYPTNIVDLGTRRSVNTYIDPELFPVGKWYMFDGYDPSTCNCENLKDSDYNYKNYAFQHGNSYIFAVVKHQNNETILNQSSENSSTVYHTTAYVFNGNESIAIPVTYVVNGTKTIEPTQTTNITNMQTIELPTTIQMETQKPTEQITNPSDQNANPDAPIVVTPRAGIQLALIISSLFVGVLLFRRN